MSDHFATLGLEATFDLDVQALARRHRDLSKTLHPDRFTDRAPSERRLALDHAIAVNAALRALRDPVSRAECLLAHHGIASDELAKQEASPELLMEMMEVREALEDALLDDRLEQFEAIGAKMRIRQGDVLKRLSQSFQSFQSASASSNDLDALRKALPLLGELRYLKRFFEELNAIEEKLLH